MTTDVSPQVPFLDLAAYQVNDDSGSIWVVSHSGAPLKGDKVGVKGRVEEAFKFGDTAISTRNTEMQKKPKGRGTKTNRAPLRNRFSAPTPRFTLFVDPGVHRIYGGRACQ